MKTLDELIAGSIHNHCRDQEAVYRQYYAYCLKIVFRYIYSYEQAVDVVNDGFAKAFVHLHQFNYKGKENLEKLFMGWLRRIMINTAIDQLRKERMIPKIGRLENNLDISDNCQTADQALLYNELIYEIKKLPPAYRAVLNMFVVDGYSHQEIATFLGISEGTSKSNLSRAREHLKKIIQKYDSLRNACNG
ncbi:MAG TPA: RNA polymerase sigma factor [Flavisolibacter sp.]|nr:RNA polymerase sigma factor [Flavisolibacter sp.]